MFLRFFLFTASIEKRGQTLKTVFDQNTALRVSFLNLFLVFGNVMKLGLSCLKYYFQHSEIFKLVQLFFIITCRCGVLRTERYYWTAPSEDKVTISQCMLCFCVYIRVNQALQFDGVDDHVSLPSIHNLGLTDRYCRRGAFTFPVVEIFCVPIHYVSFTKL